MLRSICVFSFVFLVMPFLYAEGTRQLAPNGSIVINGTPTTDIAALHINADAYNNFASYTNSDPSSRLYINIQDPTSECIYLGFSYGHLNANAGNPPAINFQYRIVDPNGNVVFGPISVNETSAEITSWQEAFNGPSALFGAGGYNATSVSSADLTSSGNTSAGNYYIEFLREGTESSFLIDFWDITVASCAATPTEKPGRVWSYNWALFAINDFGFPTRPFNGAFYVCAPDPGDASSAFISKIDFNASGFRPAAFNIAFNQFGAMNTGNIEVDRRSVEDQNSTTSQYEIFLQDPVDLCRTAEQGEIEIIGISRCSGADYCIKLIASKEGQVELLLDFDGNDNLYTPGTTDVLVTQTISSDEIDAPICIDWDGLDGLGNPLSETMSTTIPITISFAQGIYHFPIYDAEFLTDGFTVSAVRPSGPAPLLYYDDSNITTNSGSSEPKVQLNGCALPCHRWTNYTTGDAVGFGNLNTINSWWFSQQIVESEVVNLPAAVVCKLIAPDTICLPGTDTLRFSGDVMPMGADAPTIVSYEWSGPGIAGPATGETVIINDMGNYTCTVSWLTNLNDTCTSSCSIFVPGAECCAPSLTCLASPVPVPCDSILPPPASSVDDLINAGLLSVVDAECANFQLFSDVTVEQSGCSGDPQITTYSYEIWNDVNANGIIDGAEIASFCDQQFISVDTTAPTIEFTGGMSGMQHGDTLFIQCAANDPDWEIPMPSVDDVLVYDACGALTVEIQDVIEESNDCAADGFITKFTCSWFVKDDCDNTTELTIYMFLVDETPPVITQTAPDLTITCVDEIPAPQSEATDECNCAHLTINVDTLYYQCASDYALQRTYSWEDHCGNRSTSTQRITIANTASITLDIPDEIASDIDVDCENGTLPMWIAELDAQSIRATSPCGVLHTSYEINQLDGGNCSGGYASRWECIWTVGDDCGQSVTHRIEVTVVDRTPPTIVSFPDNICSDFFDPYAIEVTDNCAIDDIIYSTEILQTTCQGNPQIKHIWEVFDYCGNRTYGELIATQGDTTSPVVITYPPYQNVTSGDKITLDCTTDITLESIKGIISFNDKCDEITVDFSLETLEEMGCTPPHLGQYQATWFATDACGNYTEFQLIIEKSALDLASILPDNIIEGSCGDQLSFELPSSCLSDIVLLDDAVSISCSGAASYQVYQLSDHCGNTLIDTVHYYLVDNEPPVFDEMPDVLCVSDELPTPLAWDACENRYVDVYSVYSDIEECGLFLQMVTFIASDNCDNEARHDIIIVPEISELDLDLYYEGEKIIDGSSNEDRHQLTMDCTSRLDASLLSVEPKCDFISYYTAQNIIHEVCTNDDSTANIIYSIPISIGNCLIKTFYIDVFLTDDIAPFFINPPEDITLSCVDSLPKFDLEVFDHCSEATVEETIVSQSFDSYEVFNIRYTATDNCGNERSHEHDVTIFEAPDCSIEVPDNIICYQTATLTGSSMSGVSPYTFEWKIEQGNCELIGHTTGDGSMIDVRLFSGSATITLTVTDALGCSTTCTEIITCIPKQPTLAKSGGIAHTAIAAYPNPAFDEVHLESEKTITSIILTDIVGRSQVIEHVASRHKDLSLTDFSTGLIIVEVTTEDGSKQRLKLVKL